MSKTEFLRSILEKDPAAANQVGPVQMVLFDGFDEVITFTRKTVNDEWKRDKEKVGKK